MLISLVEISIILRELIIRLFKMYKICLFILSLLSLLICEDYFLFKEKNNTSATYQLAIGSITIENDEGYDFVTSHNNNYTQKIGLPELPTYSFNYSIKKEKNYDVEFSINGYEIYDNIELFPVQPLYKIGDDKVFVKDNILYSSNSIYPQENVSIKYMSLRGYELVNIEVIPFEYFYTY